MGIDVGIEVWLNIQKKSTIHQHLITDVRFRKTEQNNTVFMPSE